MTGWLMGIQSNKYLRIIPFLQQIHGQIEDCDAPNDSPYGRTHGLSHLEHVAPGASECYHVQQHQLDLKMLSAQTWSNLIGVGFLFGEVLMLDLKAFFEILHQNHIRLQPPVPRYLMHKILWDGLNSKQKKTKLLPVTKTPSR